jgi:hypothetical protein
MFFPPRVLCGGVGHPLLPNIGRSMKSSDRDKGVEGHPGTLH